MEIWQPINGYEGLYEVSNHGRIKSFHKYADGYILRQAKDKNSHTNYKIVMLVNKDKVRKVVRVHRLVGEAFVPNPLNKPHINHLDNNGENNNSYNLEWCTSAENTEHATKQGRNKHNNINANLRRSKKALKDRKYMIGKIYGKWTVLKDIPKEYTTKTISKMLCRCECGTEKEVDMISLKNGRSKQCKSCATRETLRRRYASSI